MTIDLYPQMVNNADEDTTNTWTELVASGTAHTKGSWVEMLPATEFDTYVVELFAGGTTSTPNVDTSILLEIGYDSAGGTSYTTLIDNVNVLGFSYIGHQRRTWFVAYIPAGSTIAGRIQAAVISEEADVGIAIYGGPEQALDSIQGPVVTYGADESDSGGVTLVDVSPADTKSAWVEIIDATTHPHQGFTLGTQPNTGSTASVDIFFDVGIGAGGSEEVIMENIWANIGGTERYAAGFPDGVLAHPIPEGSRLSVRTQTGAANRSAQFDAILYGWG